MNQALSSPIPLPIVSALAGFILSYVFPEHLNPITWTFLGFLVGSFLVQIEEWWLASTKIEARGLTEAETMLRDKKKMPSEISSSTANA